MVTLKNNKVIIIILKNYSKKIKIDKIMYTEKKSLINRVIPKSVVFTIFILKI